MKLFETLRTLASQGKTIIFVSHKLEDVEELCVRVGVLRRGELVGEAQPPFNIDELVTMMFGKLVTLGGKDSIEMGGNVLKVDKLALESARLEIRDVNLELQAGEVIGLAGMEGSGQLLFTQLRGSGAPGVRKVAAAGPGCHW